MIHTTAQVERGIHRIQPWRENPRFWQYRGEPVLLLGGSVKDNLFQIPDLEAQLDPLVSVGGNYIRNTMSDRPDGGFEIKAFAQDDEGIYDLTTWNAAYWERFESMLQLTAARDIIVQIEIWDRFDHSQGNWKLDPFRPENNRNYSNDESGLAADYPELPGGNRQPFFYTVPKLQDNELVLKFQRAFVDKMLQYSLQFDHVLYCIDNETSGDPLWAVYWAEHVQERAAAAGVGVEMAEMWDNWDVSHETHRPTFDHPERYGFVDIAQNSHNPGQMNWERAQWVRSYLTEHPRPMNSTKIYGADTSKWTDRGVDAEHGQQTFWRNLLGGLASSRFHRPPSGLGLSETAQANLRSARMLAASFDLFRAESDAALRLLSDRQENEAYVSVLSTGIPARTLDRQWAVYFRDGGHAGLDVGAAHTELKRVYDLRVLDIHESRWHEVESRSASDDGRVQLHSPAGPHVILVTETEESK